MRSIGDFKFGDLQVRAQCWAITIIFKIVNKHLYYHIIRDLLLVLEKKILWK